jgi:hypothetical protein
MVTSQMGVVRTNNLKIGELGKEWGMYAKKESKGKKQFFRQWKVFHQHWG